MKKHHQDTLSDLLKLGQAAASTLMGAAQELGDTHDRKHNMLSEQPDYASREEFNAAFAMVKKMRLTQVDLEKRITQIEAKLNLSSPVLTPNEKQILTDS